MTKSCWLKCSTRHRCRILSDRLCFVVHYITALSAQSLVVMSKTQGFCEMVVYLSFDHKYFTILWIYCIQHVQKKTIFAWWRHQMETFSALLAICAGNSQVTGEIPAQRPVTRSFEVFFDLRLNKRFSKQSWDWRFETLSCNGFEYSNLFYLWTQSSLNHIVHQVHFGSFPDNSVYQVLRLKYFLW